MTSNFKVFDENVLNLLNDSDYASNTARLNGVVTGVASNTLYNKFSYQTSIMVAAFAQFLSNAGQTVSDADYTALVAAITAVLTPVAITPSGYMHGLRTTWASNTTCNVAVGTCRDDANGYDIPITGQTISTAGTFGGAGNLDAGTIANDTWYYVWAIAKSSTGATGVLISTSRTSPTMPTGYNKKRLLPIAMQTDGSAHIREFTIGAWGPGATEVQYVASLSLSLTLVRNAWTTASAATAIPPISKFATFDIALHNASAFNIRPTGSSTIGQVVSPGLVYSSSFDGRGFGKCGVNSSQQFDYYLTSASSNASGVYISSYIITEV